MEIHKTSLVTTESNSHLLTPEKLRTYPGLESLADNDAEEAIYIIQVLAALFFEIHSKEHNTQ